MVVYWLSVYSYSLHAVSILSQSVHHYQRLALTSDTIHFVVCRIFVYKLLYAYRYTLVTASALLSTRNCIYCIIFVFHLCSVLFNSEIKHSLTHSLIRKMNRGTRMDSRQCARTRVADSTASRQCARTQVADSTASRQCARNLRRDSTVGNPLANKSILSHVTISSQ